MFHEKISLLLKKPMYLLDENIRFNNVSKSKNLFVHVTTILRRRTSDEIIFEEAKRRHLTIITRDIKFVLNMLIQKQNVIFETNDGRRYFINGKSSKFIERNISECLIKYYSKKQKRMLEFAERTPFCLPLNGFYMVSVI